LYLDRRFATPDGRARFAALPYAPPAETPEGAYPLALLTGRVRDQWHTMTRTGKIAALRRTCPAPYVELPVADAAALGIAPGDPVEVRSRRGQLARGGERADAPRLRSAVAPAGTEALRGRRAADAAR
jgi:anaerobic selenocysteine-containing dehydrogenase